MSRAEKDMLYWLTGVFNIISDQVAKILMITNLQMPPHPYIKDLWKLEVCMAIYATSHLSASNKNNTGWFSHTSL